METVTINVTMECSQNFEIPIDVYEKLACGDMHIWEWLNQDESRWAELEDTALVNWE